MFDWTDLIAPAVGAVLGSQANSGNKTTTQNSIDPRMSGYVYGDGSTPGVLPSAANWYKNNQTGLNDQMLQGLNQQWGVLSNPATAQGYNNMQALGSQLMGGQVAGNPFSDGRINLNTGHGMAGGGQQMQTHPLQVAQAQQPQYPSSMSSPGAGGPFTQPGAQTWDPTAQATAPGQMVALPLADVGGTVSGHNGNPGAGGGATSAGAGSAMGGYGGLLGRIAGGLLGGPLGGMVGELAARQAQGSGDPGGSMNGMSLLGANAGNMLGMYGAGANGFFGGTDGLSAALGPSAFGTAPGYGLAGWGTGNDGVRAYGGMNDSNGNGPGIGGNRGSGD